MPTPPRFCRLKGDFMRTVFINAKVVSPYRVFSGNVVVSGKKISTVSQVEKPEILPGDMVIDAKGLYLSPGFVELHTHGAGNSDVMDGTVEAVCTVCRTHMQYGTTAIVPSTLCATDEELFETFNNIDKASKIKDNMPEILGVHLEGPYLSPAQSGAQDPKFIKKIDKSEYERIYAQCPSIKVWTVAPELPGAMEMGNWLKEKGIVASIGHTDAVYEDVVEAIENGYTMVTHLFNGMSRLKRRNSTMYLGVAESGLCFDSLTVEVIADGKHLPPSLLKLIYKVKGPLGICLVTDSMRAAGVHTTKSIIGSLKNGQPVEIEDGVAYMPGRQSFGGSVSTSDRLIRTMYKLADVPLHEAVTMMTVVPSRILKVDDRLGSITEGKDADILLFDDEIRMKLVMCKGEIYLDKLEC